MLEAGIDAEIRDRLLLQAANAADLEVTPAELSAAREQTRRLLGDARFRDMLASRGAEEKDFDAFLRKRLLIDKYKARLFGGIRVDEATLRSYYAGHQELFSVPRRVQLETIGLDDRDIAQQIYADLKDGKDFRQAAARHAAQSGVSSGVVTNRVVIEEMPAELRLLVESAGPGDVLEPVEDGGRIHVIRIVDIEPAHTLTFDQAQAGLEASLLRRRQQAKLEDWFEQARGKAAIEYYPPQRTGH
jgi:peptidyl-prolyl cis-trans isomerase C